MSMWPGAASWAVWGAVSERRAGGAEKGCGSGGLRARLAALQEHCVAAEAQFWRRTTPAPQRRRLRGPADAVLADRSATSLTADVDAQRVALAQEPATAPRKT